MIVIFFSEISMKTLLTHTPVSKGLHTHIIKHLVQTQPNNKSWGTVTLYSGQQHIAVPAVLLRNASHLLKDMIPSPCSCSCTDTCIILPHTPYPTLASSVELLSEGYISSVSNNVAKAITSIATLLGIANISETTIDMTEADDIEDEDLCCKFDQSLSEINENGPIDINSTLKVKTMIKFSDQSLTLHFPRSRLERKRNPNPTKLFQPNTFKGRIQEEYNLHPVGQYMGPYDQNEEVKLSAQLPSSTLDFQSYTEFSHDGEKCFEYKMKNYEKIGLLDKIDGYTVCSAIKSAADRKEIDDNDIFYTCQHKLCMIPCPCAHCSSDITQCLEHKLCHPSLFDDQVDAVSIRSSEEFCKDDIFFEKSYIIKYPGIPRKCRKCYNDLLNHHCYHFEFHTNCRFCSPTFYKAKATSKKELDFLIKDEANYYKTVCPHCNKRFCQAYFMRKHVESEHGEKPFKCEKCEKRFQSLIAKSYHEQTHHAGEVKVFDCNVCGKQFKSGIHLKQHVKYVHSDTRRWNCDECDAKFKQKRDLRIHVFNKHNVNYSTEDYDENQSKTSKVIKCEQCEATFWYRKNLSAHMKTKHTIGESFQCDKCNSIFKNKKTMVAHKRYKHEQLDLDISCKVCGKTFAERRSLKRHEKSHSA